MGNFIPIAAMTALKIAQGQGQAKVQNSAYREQARQQIDILRRNQEIEARKRRDQLRRTQATQMARFGAQGISSSGGSADALLEGLSKRSAQNTQDSRTLTNIRIGNINNRLSQRRRINLLERRKTALDKFGKSFQNIPLIMD